MTFKLNRIEDSDIFYLVAGTAKCLGETLIEGSFNEVFAYAAQMKINDAKDLGSGDYYQVTNAQVTSISASKWFLIDLNNLYQMTNLDEIARNGVLMIVKTKADEVWSLPTNRYSTTGTLDEIFNRVYVYVNDLLNQ